MVAIEVLNYYSKSVAILKAGLVVSRFCNNNFVAGLSKFELTPLASRIDYPVTVVR